MGYVDCEFFEHLSNSDHEYVEVMATQIVDEFVRGTDKILRDKIEKKEIGGNDLVLSVDDRKSIRQEFIKMVSEINRLHKIKSHPYNLGGLK